MRIVLTGGGTAGHVVPNFAVIEELKKKGQHQFLYIGSLDGVEETMVKKSGINYRGVYCGKLRRYFSMRNFMDFFKVPIGIWQAYGELKKFKADVVFSKGGFVAVPTVVAAYMLKIPVIIHESDVVPGLANKLVARYARKICVSFENSKKYFKKYGEKVLVTGNPVREFLRNGDREKAYKFTGLDRHRPVILVMGGSQGAKQINDLIRDSLDELLKKFQIVHICGRGNLNIGLHHKGYVQYEYLEEQLADVYALCEMIISRGGANSLAEIAFLKKKALIIPLGKEASRGDQMDNARVFAKDFGWAILSGEINRNDFIKTVVMSYNNRMNQEAKFKNGSKEIAEIILKAGK